VHLGQGEDRRVPGPEVGDVPADPNHYFFSAWQFCQWFDALPDEDGENDEAKTGATPTPALCSD